MPVVHSPVLFSSSELNTVTKTCGNCGKSNRESATYCAYCGSGLDDKNGSESLRSRRKGAEGIDPGVFLKWGGIITGASLVLAAISTILYFLFAAGNAPTVSPAFLSAILGIVSSIVLVLIGFSVLRISKSMEFPENFLPFGYLIFFFFVLDGTGFLINGLISAGISMVIGALLILVTAYASALKTFPSRVSTPVLGILGTLLVFTAYVAVLPSPGYGGIIPQIIVSGSGLNILLPQAVYSVFGFMGAYPYLGLIAALTVLLATLFKSFDLSRPVKDIVSSVSAAGLVIFSIGEILSGYLAAIEASASQNASYYAGSSYQYLIQGFLYATIVAGILFAIGGFFLLLGSFIYAAYKASDTLVPE